MDTQKIELNHYYTDCGCSRGKAIVEIAGRKFEIKAWFAVGGDNCPHKHEWEDLDHVRIIPIKS